MSKFSFNFCYSMLGYVFCSIRINSFASFAIMAYYDTVKVLLRYVYALNCQSLRLTHMYV